MALQLLENNGYRPLPANLSEVVGWAPMNSAQLTAINCRAQVLLYGGQSGGGKTNWLVADAAQEYDNPNFRGLLLRKSFGEMNQIIDECAKIFGPLGARKSEGGQMWKFPSGAQLRLGYMASDKHVERYTGVPVSWLGIDEAQFQTEDRVRKLFPWVASTDPKLRVRIRMTANPSAPWLMSLFLNNQCPVCHPNKSVIPCAIYDGARWKSDDGLVMKTTCFIPARVDQNPHYGDEKVAALMSQTADVRRKLLDGCWCHTEGAFLPFLNESYLVPYSEVKEQWWWAHFLSMDYGFSNSAAATGLYAVNESGRIFKVMENTERKMYSEEYAHHIAKLMVERKIGMPERRIQIVAGYADSAMDAHTGTTGRSNLEIINEVLQKFDVHLIGGAKAPVASAQLLAGKIQRREFVITDNCPKTFECWQSRKSDPENPGAVLKVPGDELDDIKDTDLYGLNNFCHGAKKPREIEIEEKIHDMEESGADERSILVERWRMDRDTQRSQTPISVARPTIGRVQVRR